MTTSNFTWHSDSILSRMKSSTGDFNDYFNRVRRYNNESIVSRVPVVFERKFLTIDEIFSDGNAKFRFEYNVIFKHIEFKDTSIFQYIEFVKNVRFENCKFINFENLSFKNFEFIGCDFEEECSLVDRGSTHLSHFCSCQFKGNLKFSEFRLHKINFKDCKFNGDINSRNVDFIEVKFSNCKFVNFEVCNTKPNYHAGNETINYKLPIFELCKFSGNFIATKCYIDDCFLACNFEKIPFFNGSSEGSFQNFDSIKIETSVTNIDTPLEK